jgi:1-phosphatidylinositol phosphodiesterase
VIFFFGLNSLRRYAIPSVAVIPEKVQEAAANLIPPKDSAQPVLPISFFSGSSFPLALPPTVAKGIAGVEGANSLLGRWLLGQIGIGPMSTSVVGSSSAQAQAEPRIRGWAFLDYYTEPSGIEVVPLLVECNFLGRIPGEEGW